MPRPRWPTEAELFSDPATADVGGSIALSQPMAISRAGRIAIGAAAAFAAITVVAFVGVAMLLPLSAEKARERFVAILADRLDAEVELQELRVHMLPSLRAEGRGLAIRHRGRRDVPPLISIAHFSAESQVTSLLRRHISRVDIDGLDIQIPPDRNRNAAGDDNPAAPGRDPDGARTDVART